jgi:hypothetical protein
MRLCCCPPNRGCNASGTEQPCVLTIFRAAAPTTEEARRAVDRWEALQRLEREGAGASERRFRRRAYERARQEALAAVAMDLAAEAPSGEPRVRRRRRRRRTRAARSGRGPRRGRAPTATGFA